MCLTIENNTIIRRPLMLNGKRSTNWSVTWCQSTFKKLIKQTKTITALENWPLKVSLFFWYFEVAQIDLQSFRDNSRRNFFISFLIKERNLPHLVNNFKVVNKFVFRSQYGAHSLQFSPAKFKTVQSIEQTIHDITNNTLDSLTLLYCL